MSDTPTDEYGPNLARYIDQLRGATSVRQFAADHGLDAQRISTWGSGSKPSWEHLRPTAEGLNLTLGELLVIMGVGTKEDFYVRAGGPASVDEALTLDKSLTDEEREFLVSIREMQQNARRGVNTRSRKVTSRLQPDIKSTRRKT